MCEVKPDPQSTEEGDCHFKTEPGQGYEIFEKNVCTKIPTNDREHYKTEQFILIVVSEQFRRVHWWKNCGMELKHFFHGCCFTGLSKIEFL